jgi:magnesium transporter
LDDIPKGMIRWIKFTGLTDSSVLEKVSEDLHPLVMEDILNPFQRPKFEDYGEYIYIILKKMDFDQSSDEINFEQISLILGEHFVMSFEEQKSELFDTIVERIKVPKGRIRFMGPDYLMYALIDVVVDYYFIVLETFGVSIEEIEEVLIYDPEPEVLQRIYDLKRKTINIRKSIWPMREVINKLQREHSKLISDGLQYYLRDIYDHVFRITDLLENYRDIIFGMLDMYLSSVSNRMNDIMKVLTIISTVFIPLSFLTGFYGMNFHYMPELANPFAYPILILVMITIFSVMIFFFRRKKWI